MKRKMIALLTALLLTATLLSACDLSNIPAAALKPGDIDALLEATAVLPEQPAVQPEAITLEQAKQLIFDHLGITEDQVTRPEYKLDDGKYEIDFHISDTEFDCEVSLNGQILKIEKEQKAPAPSHPVPAEPVPTAPAPTEPAPTLPPAQSENITLEQAKQLIFAHLGISEDQVTRPEYRLDDGRYEIDFHLGNTEYDCEVSLSGKILKVEKEQERPAPTAPPVQSQTITLEQAKQLIFDRLGITEKQISRLETDMDDGKFEIEFHIGNAEYDCEVSFSGQILQLEKEIDD